ncbi:YidC/Oxa1 family membrane protein insertase [Acetoanaerobium noterae]|uniref:Sec-independent factor for membrane protein insertion (YidC/SpoIIIJ family) n=2 Tax=Acetoanaerobium TaxID=186831 RepID=E3PVZ9_ACESD|nr:MULTISPECIES: YidC/Oxa1 family membrane protein insertase [Acetoanaerobium]MBP9499669.1 YidC/Oxa1 family membrane protein insertase [Acetoanaerobium sp.]MBP9562229.1 YidC/Oxa1 family membrane protein insertase [Acetoanaerobium sp.]CBH22702.1 Sec-independent factor for membrane protein insertion (YidC/SpoIIIJ family) [Acetoanaerobium sticklandii]SKB65825.1 YidC/Oxa1 family membrane protein insertase [Acetoanaerobium noterae]
MSQLSYLFGSLLELIYNVIGDYAISIIVFTVVVKLLLLPLTLTQTKSMKSMQLIQPKMDEIKKKYQNDPDKQNQKIMELYKEHKVNPLAGCLPLLIQFPIIIGLFNALREPVKYVFGTEAAYKIADTGFLWVNNLASPDVILLGGISIPFILPILAAITTYIQSAMMSPKGGKKDPTQTMMLYMFPIMMLFWGISFPAGLLLYWVAGNIFQIVQQYILSKPSKAKEAS